MNLAQTLRPRLSICLLGETRLVRDGEPWRGKLYDKVIALLAYLIAEPDRSHSREQLATLLWPSLPADAARTNLRQTLYYLRQVFGADTDELLHANRETVRFVHSADHCWIDVRTLTEQAPTCRDCPTTPMSPPCDRCLERLKARADSYQGEFLAGLALADAPDFDVWLDAQRQRLRGQAFSCAERLRIAYERKGRLGPALAYAQRCVQLEPWNEAGHREHMRLLATKGEHGTAQAFYDAYRETLARDLNVEPEPSTHTLFETIHKRTLEPAEIPPPPAPPVPEALIGRRQATILCCHIDPKPGAPYEAPEQIAQARSLCAAVLRRHAGHIALGQGGHIYAYMGYPQASEHAGELAAQTSLELLARFSGRYRFRAGIHTGIILAGFDPALPDIVGNVSSAAWRLCKRLQKSGVAVSESTRLLLHGRYQLEPLSALVVGKEDSPGQTSPMPVHRLVGPARAGQAGPGEAVPAALLGRKAELRRLQESWSRASSGSPQFLVIRGEPGMGKTRLADALRELVDPGASLIRHLHCYPERQHTPLYPIIALFESIMGFAANDTPRQQREKLDHYLNQHHFDVADQAAPLLMAMLSIAPNEASVLSPRQRKLQTLDMLLTLLDNMASRHALLLLIEDAQWLDITSGDLLERLVHRRDRLALFTLVTARPEFKPPWLRDDAILELAPLKDEHIARLARATAGALSRQAVERIVRRADGIPLYAEEMAQLPAGSDDGDAIPTTLRYLLLTRLDAVPHARRVMQLAATLGRKFEKGLLLHVSELEEDELDDILGELIDARLVAPAGALGDTFQFHHSLIQEAAYESQILPDKQEAHLRVARSLDLHFARRATQLPGEVARHYTAAGDTRAAIPWWLGAGRQALRVSACAEAAGHLQNGLDLVAALPRDEGRDALERELLLALGKALLRLRGYGSEDAAETFDRALALDDEHVTPGQRFEILWGQWMVSSSRKGSSFMKSCELAQLLIRQALESGDAHLLAQAYSAATNISLWRNRLDEACRYAQAALELPGPADSSASEGLDPHVTSLAHLSWALWRVNDVHEALAASRKSIEMARSRDNPDTLCFALAFAATLHRFLGNADVAARLARELRSDAEAYGLVLWQGIADMLLAWKRVRDGNEEGLSQLNACVQGIRLAMPGVAVMFIHAQAEAYGFAGRIDEQLHAIDEGLRAADQVHEGFFSALLRQMRDECLVRRTPL